MDPIIILEKHKRFPLEAITGRVSGSDAMHDPFPGRRVSRVEATGESERERKREKSLRTGVVSSVCCGRDCCEDQPDLLR